MYGSWPECAAHVINFKGAMYASYKSNEEAIDAYDSYFRHTGVEGASSKDSTGVGDRNGAKEEPNESVGKFRGCHCMPEDPC